MTSTLREEILNEYFPHCIAIGIGASEFWDSTPKQLRPYFKAEEIKWQRRNIEMHTQGQYFFDAISIALSNAFRKSGTPVTPYVKPYEFKSNDEAENERRELAKQERMKAEFMAFAERTKRRLNSNDEE